MTIKSDNWIKRSVETKILGIEPFFAESVNNINGKKVPSYGLTSYGYDIRLGRNFKVARHSELSSPNRSSANYYVNGHKVSGERDSQVFINMKPYDDSCVDVCDFDDKFFAELNDVDDIIIPPHGFVLGHSMEKITIPRNVSAVCMGKSTIARCGLIVIVTPLEPEWSGFITLEIFNTLRMPIKLRSGIGITQVQFFESDESCSVSYADRKGKYQNQPALPISPRN